MESAHARFNTDYLDNGSLNLYEPLPTKVKGFYARLLDAPQGLGGQAMDGPQVLEDPLSMNLSDSEREDEPALRLGPLTPPAMADWPLGA